MQSQQLWFKKLAKSSFQNGQWITDAEIGIAGNPFETLRDDLIEALEIYNSHATSPIKSLPPSTPGRTLITLLHGTTQLRLTANEGYLDISIVVTRQFQTAELPLTRLSPRVDQFGATHWHRGNTELSTEQVIKNALIHLIEASGSIG